jgi:hypothetical protein
MSTEKKFSLKPLFASVLLAIGISPVVEADEVFENYNGYNQQTFYAPQFTLGGFYGNDGGSYGEADILYPLIQDPFQLFYTDIRAQKDDASMWQAAVGLGYRFLTPDAQQLYGAYVFYNYENSYLNNAFQQIIGGLEFKTNYIGARVNYYHSVGQTKVYESTQNGITFSGVGGINYNMLVANAYEGQIIQGGTAEIGGPIPYATGLRLFGGYYHFVGNAGQSTIAGPSARMEYRLEEALNLQVPFVERLTFESTWQHDQVNGNLWTVGFRLTLPMGYNNSSTGLQKEMTDYVRFNRAPVPSTGYDTPTINQTNGHNTVFAFVNSGNDFTTATTDTPDVIVINQNIEVVGNQTLPDNVLITGQNFEYAPGLIANVTGKNTVTNISAPDNTSVFYLGENNTIQDLAVNQAISNTGNSVGNLTINNITSTNGGININVSDLGDNSQITINGNNFNLNNGTAIYLSTAVGSTMNIASINNNNITIQPGNNNIGIDLENEGVQNAGTISGNTIVIGSSTGTGDSEGILINNTSGQIDGHQTVDAINDNIITIGDSGGDTNQFDGINITSSGKIQTINSINGNNITVTPNPSSTTQFINGINIYAQNETTQNVYNLIDNEFIFSGNADGITAIDIWAVENSAIIINGFNNNLVTNSQGEDISLTTGKTSTITVKTGVNTPNNPTGSGALSAANNQVNVSLDNNYAPDNPGTITIMDN